MGRLFFYMFGFCLFVSLFVPFGSAALGISPAIKEVNFVPGANYEWDYHIISDDPDKKIFISVDGDLAQYVSLSRSQASGEGEFTVTLNLPSDIDLPGQHTIAINLEEEPPETEFIGVAIRISGALRVFVPYPGRYAELALSIPDINMNELIPVEIHMVNRGKEAISISNISVKFTNRDTGSSVDSLSFTPVDLEVSGDRYFRKYLNSSSFLPGNYMAVASVVSSSDIWSVNKSFRIGSLFVNITNYTNVIYNNKGIQKFYVNLQSKWNGALSPVYVDVNITNGSTFFSFRTPSADLAPWADYKIESYVDPSELPLGDYKSVLTVSYPGANNTVSGIISVKKYYSPYLYYAIIGAVLLIVLVIVVLWLVLRRRKSSREKN